MVGRRGKTNAMQPSLSRSPGEKECGEILGLILCQDLEHVPLGQPALTQAQRMLSRAPTAPGDTSSHGVVACKTS